MATKKRRGTRQRARTSVTPAQTQETDRGLVDVGLSSIRRPAGKLPWVEEVQDTPEYLAGWAKAIREAVPAEDLRKLVEDYRTIAGNPKLGREDRAAARRRAQVLEGRPGRTRTRGLLPPGR